MEKFNASGRQTRILCLGNEFIREDSLAKRLYSNLSKSGLEIINIKDSFELLEFLQSEDELTILDVVKGLSEPGFIRPESICTSSLLTAHDFDAGFLLKLYSARGSLRIIGLPQSLDLLDLNNNQTRVPIDRMHELTIKVLSLIRPDSF